MKIVKLDLGDAEHLRILHELMEKHLSEVNNTVRTIYGPPQYDKTARAKENSAHVNKVATLMSKVKRRFERREDHLKRAIREGNGVVHVAFEEGKPIGYVYSYRDAKMAHALAETIRKANGGLKNAGTEELARAVLFGGHGYILPDYRSKGSGKELYEQHEKAAIDDFHTTATHRVAQLETDEEDGRRFLKKQGYKTIGTHDDREISIKRIVSFRE